VCTERSVWFKSYNCHIIVRLQNLLMCKYRVMLEEGSVFGEVVVSVFVRETFHMDVCPVQNGYLDGAV